MPDAGGHDGSGPGDGTELVRRLCGSDADAVMGPVEKLQLVSALELTHGIELPTDLVTVLDTAGDVLHFVGLRLAQRGGP